MRHALTYDDINLVPAYSTVRSRSDVSLVTKLSRNYKIGIPVIASPMDTVCDSNMAKVLYKYGAIGCIHRFNSIEDQGLEVERVRTYIGNSLVLDNTDNFSLYKINTHFPLMAAIGATGDYLERAQHLVQMGATVLLIDVAHGHHEHVVTALTELKKILPKHVDIIAGNVVTNEAARLLANNGVDGIRVGVGGGSMCTTRLKTGFGVPNVTALHDCNLFSDVPMIADGGIRYPGDIAKALAVGASSVMLGSMLAGTEEAPGDIILKPTGLYKRYRGSASLEMKSSHGLSQRHVEGESTVIPYKGSVSIILEDIIDSLKSAFSYAGATNIDEYKPELVVVTGAGVMEAKPHLL